MTAPVYFTWDGDVMVPLKRFAKLCDKEFVVGQTYPLEVSNARSQATHNHFFASVQDAWNNLPERLAEQFPTSEHLRKYALIKAGFADRRSIVAASKAEAGRIAAFIKPMDEFSVVTVSGSVVTVYTAQSQSMRAMGKDDFQASKQAVLDVLSTMIGVTTQELQAHEAA